MAGTSRSDRWGQLENQKILICGAGIAGPTMAYWLQQFGFEPTLIERAPALREGGYIIDFWGLGFDVAEKMGLLPALKNDGYEIDEVRLVNEQGKRIGGFGAHAFQSMLGERYLSILRSDLAKRIYESLGGRVKTTFGDSITAIEQDDDGVRVAFKHAAPERFDLVIGAGGLHSPVRKLVFGPEGRFEKYLGYYAASFRAENRTPMSATLSQAGRYPGIRCAEIAPSSSSSFQERPNCWLCNTTSRHKRKFCARYSGKTGGSARIFSKPWRRAPTSISIA
jgi:2-polyprenyl-6-methoxyphenol hydroxylase-like FAD-dependent oxidoreductase